ncbi:GxxExxY protein [Candidatus Gottesmanbacteria bacterium]|nr:GxxExxY protein [Candidatus Gottesmanbacteria bacterium]
MKSDLADDFPHKELTYKIIGCFFKVHNFLGNSLEERYYQRSLEKEFTDSGLKFEKEREIELLYNGESIGKHRADFIVEGKIIVETKTLPYLDSKSTTQLLAYLKSTGIKIGFVNPLIR